MKLLFWLQKLMACSINSLKVQVTQPALVEQRTLGRWAIHSCLACGQPTHAISHDKNGPYALLVCKSNQVSINFSVQLHSVSIININ